MIDDLQPGHRPGDKIGRFTIGRTIAFRGLEGCESVECTRVGMTFADGEVVDWGRCHGWHCSVCHAPCSMMGHDCPEDPDKLAAS